MANLQSGKYRNEDGSLNYDQALSDAELLSMLIAAKPGEQHGGKTDYTQSPRSN